MVTCGTFRSLFQLAYMPKQCELIMVRDINYRVYYYLQFIVILFKFCKNFDEFKTHFGDRSEVRDIEDYFLGRISNSEISEELKVFYRSILHRSIETFYDVNQRSSDRPWKTVRQHVVERCSTEVSDFKIIQRDTSLWDGVNFWENEAIYKIMQALILQNKFVVTCGNMNEVGWYAQLKNLTVPLLRTLIVLIYTIIRNLTFLH